MNKNEIKDYMIVETGYDNEKYLVIKGKLVNNELNGFSIDDFDDNLINKNFKPASISKVYESVPITVPFDLDIENILLKYNPKTLWERTPTKVSRKFLSNLKKEKVSKYLDKLVFPVRIVD